MDNYDNLMGIDSTKPVDVMEDLSLSDLETSEVSDNGMLTTQGLKGAGGNKDNSEAGVTGLITKQGVMEKGEDNDKSEVSKEKGLYSTRGVMETGGNQEKSEDGSIGLFTTQGVKEKGGENDQSKGGTLSSNDFEPFGAYIPNNITEELHNRHMSELLPELNTYDTTTTPLKTGWRDMDDTYVQNREFINVQMKIKDTEIAKLKQQNLEMEKKLALAKIENVDSEIRAKSFQPTGKMTELEVLQELAKYSLDMVKYPTKVTEQRELLRLLRDQKWSAVQKKFKFLHPS